MRLTAKMPSKPRVKPAGQGELFETETASHQVRPRAPRRVLMHVCDAGDCQAGTAEDLGKPMCRMKCGRCGAETDWLIFDTVTEAKRGIPCEACNKDSK